jgi:hypothetical protein
MPLRFPLLRLVAGDDEVDVVVAQGFVALQANVQDLARAHAFEPELGANEEIGLEALARVKYFTPDSRWTWYASEFDGEDLFFGLVIGFEIELGYFSLRELQEARGPLGLHIERDLYYEPKSLRELREQHRRERGE